MTGSARCHFGLSFLEYALDPGMYFKLFCIVALGLSRDLFLCTDFSFRNKWCGGVSKRDGVGSSTDGAETGETSSVRAPQLRRDCCLQEEVT